MKDLTQGSVTKHLLQMTAFLAISMAVQTLYLLADLYYDGRVSRLEEPLAGEASEVGAETQKRLDGLGRFIKGEVDSIKSRAAVEHGERCNATDKLGRDLAETARTLDTQINNLNGQTAKSLGELRELLLEQSKMLSAEIKEKYDQMKLALEHEAAQIRDAMTGREALA